MAVNPSAFSFVFLLISTLFSATSASSSTSLSYSHHCASMVPESTPTTPSTTIFPSLQPVLSDYTGGDRILNNITSLFYEKYLRFRPTQNIFKTNTTGVYKIEAYLIFGSPNYYDLPQNSIHGGSYFPSSHSSQDSFLRFLLNGFWSENSGKLCMVGSGSWYSNEGILINLDAVLKLNYAVNFAIFSSLITGKLESLASPNDPNYFEPISLMGFGTSSNYQYPLVSGEFDRDCPGGVTIPKNQSLDLNQCFCYILGGRYQVFNLEYSNECSSLKNCTPLGKDANNELPSEMMMRAIQCSDEDQKVQYVIKFSSDYQHFDPSTTLVGEALWDENENQLSIVACRLVSSTGSLENVRVGDCSIRLSLRYFAFWSIQNREKIVGQIWTNKTSNDFGYFPSITFRRSYKSRYDVPGLRYEYTLTEKVRKLCPFSKPVITNGDRYPKGDFYNLEFQDYGGFRALPDSVGDQTHGEVRNPLPTSRSTSASSSPVNVSYTIEPYNFGQCSSAVSGNNPLSMFHITAEGLYDEETGKLCMVGCRKLSTGESTDCEILLKFQFPPVNAKKGGLIRGSIESMREESDPLYFKQRKTTATPNYRAQAERYGPYGPRLYSRRLILRGVMLLLSNPLACVFIGLKILHAKRNPQVLPFVSLLMLLFLTLGHMIPLVLDFEALFLGNRDQDTLLLGRGGWVEVIDYVIRPLAVVAFLLQFRLLQLAFSARLSNETCKGLWVAEMKAWFVSTILYTLGLLLVMFLSTRKQNHRSATIVSSSNSVVHSMHFVVGELITYGGSVLDSFLLPQILFNIFQISKRNALSHLFYIGTTCLRLLPRAYNLFLVPKYARVQFHGGYAFGNPNVDFYSTSWNVVISCGGVLFAVVIYLQQRFGGRWIFPRRFRVVEVYEKVPVVSSNQ